MKRLARFASRSARPTQDISSLVPRKGIVNLIGPDGVKAVALNSIKLSRGERMQVVNLKPNGEDADPTVSLKILSDSAAGANTISGGSKTAKKEKQPKKPQVKDVIISWLISRHDLDGQKRKAVESVLTRGHTLQLRLESKTRPRRPPSAEELEARELLVERTRALASEYGEEFKPAEGSIQTRLMLFYRSQETR